MRHASGLAILMFVAASAPFEAAAQLSGEQVSKLAEADQAGKESSGSLGAGIFAGAIGEDIFITPLLRLNFEQANWGFGLQVPLRLRIIDRDPKNDDDIGGIIREEDWDEPQDFLRVIRFVYVGQRDKKGPFYVRIGELSGLTVGYGTIMHRYHNGMDISRWHTGLNVAVNIDFDGSATSTTGERDPSKTSMGVEAMVGDLFDPYVVGARFTAKPLQLALGTGPWDMVNAGFTLMADTRAPFELQRDPTTGVVGVDQETSVATVTRERALAIYGVDLGVDLVDTGLLSITPYTALNKMNVVDNGWGWHAGVWWKLNVPLLIDTLTANLRTEYRRVSHDYVGPYFNTLYEIERFQLLDAQGGTAQPKLRALCGGVALDCSENNTAGRNGIFLELLAGLPNFVYVGGEYLAYDDDQKDGIFRLSLEVPALEIVRFSAFYYRVNVEGLNDLFAIDDRSAIVAQASVPLGYFLTAEARWWRVWEPGPTGYESVDDWSVGVGFELAL